MPCHAKQTSLPILQTFQFMPRWQACCIPIVVHVQLDVLPGNHIVSRSHDILVFLQAFDTSGIHRHCPREAGNTANVSLAGSPTPRACASNHVGSITKFVLCVSISCSGIMICSICSQELCGTNTRASWRWPCGHGVHMRCVTKCRASLLSIAKPCCLCKTESSPGALTSFHRMFPNAFRKILEEGPATEVRVRVPIVRVPVIAALCCPRIMPGSEEGMFAEVPGDNRMYYTGLNDAGWMPWSA